MTETVFPPCPWPMLPIIGSAALYPVHRIFCVGRNYAAHAAEMGNEVDREAPFYFTKSALATLAAGDGAGAVLPYPPGSTDVHHEIELVLAIAAAGFRVDAGAAAAHVGFYGCGLDMTRRDLQQIAKDKRRSWDLGKDGEGLAVLGPLTPAAGFAPAGQTIRLTVNDETRQQAPLSDMIWSVAEIVADLSRFYHLAPGDIIMTGTPAGVGAVQPGDRLRGEIDGLAPLDLTIGPAE